MPYCPVCRYEYREGFARCPDCDAPLVARLPEQPGRPAGQQDEETALVTVATFFYAMDAEMAKLRLESEGIKSVLVNEVLSRLDGPIFTMYPIKLQVRRGDVVRARRLLQQEKEP